MLDAGRYEALLPYAVALEVEEAWTEKFTTAVAAQAREQFVAGGTSEAKRTLVAGQRQLREWKRQATETERSVPLLVHHGTQ